MRTHVVEHFPFRCRHTQPDKPRCPTLWLSVRAKETNYSPFNIQYRVCLHFFRKCHSRCTNTQFQQMKRFTFVSQLTPKQMKTNFFFSIVFFFPSNVFFSFLSSNGKFTDTLTNDVRHKQASVASFETLKHALLLGWWWSVSDEHIAKIARAHTNVRCPNVLFINIRLSIAIDLVNSNVSYRKCWCRQYIRSICANCTYSIVRVFSGRLFA